MRKIFSALLSVALMLGLAACGASPASAWEPEHEIRYIVPYNPGGASDAIGRIAAEFMSRELGVPVVVENIAGAGCVIGWNEVFTQPADGYTITMGSTVACPWSVEALSPEKPPFEADDFMPVGSATGIGSTGGIICKRDRWPDFMAFIADVKANPGKIKFGIQGPGQPMEFEVWELEQLAGLNFNVVFYPGSADIQTDILTGDLDIGIVNANREEFVNNTNFSILALEGDGVPEGYPVQGLPFLADYAEQLGFKWEDTSFLKRDFVRQDILVRADTPIEIRERFEKCMENVTNNPEYREKILVTGWPYFESSASAIANYRELRDEWMKFRNSPAYDVWMEKVQ